MKFHPGLTYDFKRFSEDVLVEVNSFRSSHDRLMEDDPLVGHLDEVIISGEGLQDLFLSALDRRFERKSELRRQKTLDKVDILIEIMIEKREHRSPRSLIYRMIVLGETVDIILFLAIFISIGPGYSTMLIDYAHRRAVQSECLTLSIA